MTLLPIQDDDGWHSMQKEEFRARIRETIADELGGVLDRMGYTKNTDSRAEAKATIVSWALRIVDEARPEGRDPNIYTAQPIGGSPNFGGQREAIGYNQGVNDYATALKQRIEKEKA